VRGDKNFLKKVYFPLALLFLQKLSGAKRIFENSKIKTAGKGFLKRGRGLGRERNFFPQKKFLSLPKKHHSVS
jgi:hypothetical protein